MKIDLQEIANESFNQIRKETKELIDRNIKSHVSEKLRCLFLTKREIINYKQRPYLSDETKAIINNPDAGYMSDLIQEAIDNIALDEKLKETVKKYAEANFQKHLEAAMDKALQHKANNIAFNTIKEQNLKGEAS